MKEIDHVIERNENQPRQRKCHPVSEERNEGSRSVKSSV